ncbi:nicotinate-nucleotide--dimethylbenzimidazole phosphoribosyltransferase [Aestuariibius sp. 2305UL40-4]|uniref:nicotinate-nucleotide--dimethylbenzimidazole phosphoribosyltransferase n=1 Tax=Aestuariibius violaceus TaxID=3234132 RepID=UPI00345E54C8
MAAPFTTLSEFQTVLSTLAGPDAEAVAAVRARDAQLTKPPGALGRLEALAEWYASWRGDASVRCERPQVIVFAGNHGVVAQGVSAFPAEVTVQMVANFHAGGAAINQLAELAGAQLHVHDLALDAPVADFTAAPAMSEAEVVSALSAGWEAVDPEADLVMTGEMGIGNTTSAAALAAALFGGEAEEWVGRGTGVDDVGLAVKRRVVSEGVARHGGQAPLELLRCLGGRELAAMAGAIASARARRIPVILDGFICCAAAAALEKAVPGALDHAVAGHRSAEAAHAKVLDALGKEPLLDLGMRLGEGTGAALAVQILRGALACHHGMATFAQAGVSEG